MQIDNTSQRTLALPPFPRDVALLILGNLSVSDLIRCARVSRGLRELTLQDRFWKPMAISLEVPVNLAGDAPAGETMAAVAAKVAALKQDRDVANPLLDQILNQNARITAGLNQAWIANMASLRRSAQDFEIDREQKKYSCQILEKGMGAHLLLRRVSMSNLENLHKYAKVLEEKYDQLGPYEKIAQEHIREHDYDAAHRVADQHLDNYDFKRSKVYFTIISQYSIKGDFEKALEFLRKKNSGKFDHFHLDEECVIILVRSSMEKGDLSIPLRMLRENLIPRHMACDVILNLVKRYLDRKQNLVASGILDEFNQELEIPSGDDEVHDLVVYYVKLGKIQKARDLARANEKIPNTLHALRKAFSNIGLPQEAEKVQAIIDQKYGIETNQIKEAQDFLWRLNIGSGNNSNLKK